MSKLAHVGPLAKRLTLVDGHVVKTSAKGAKMRKPKPRKWSCRLGRNVRV